MTRLAVALTLILLALGGCSYYGYADPAYPAHGYGAPYSNSSGTYDWGGGNGSNSSGG